jgi:hypothetical protein
VKPYTVSLHRSEERVLTLRAPSPSDAVQEAERQSPGFVADAVMVDDDSVEVYGRCESCSIVLFETSEYRSDGETDLCMACVELEETTADEILSDEERR